MISTVTLKKVFATLAALVGLVASAVGILSYFEHRSVIEIGGSWIITDYIENGPFTGTTLTFKIFLTQNGNNFTGTGEKWSENGKDVPPSQRTPLTVISGNIQGKEVTATFIEQGLKRKTRGQFFWKMDDNNHLIGSYTSTSSKGSSLGTRLR